MSESFNGPAGHQFSFPDNTKVSWSVVSQSAGVQQMQVLDPNGHVIVDTSVLSTTMENVSSGQFNVGGGGTYTVKFPTDHSVMYDTATINTGRETVSETILFAGEDGTDNDYNDVFATMTWFARLG